MSEATRPVKEVEIDVRTLDDVARDPHHSISPPDFLMVDAEGSDYDVLAGARDSLGARCVAVSVEAQFQPIWCNQRLFGDTCGLLDELGFDLASISPAGGLSPLRVPVGLRGRALHTSCDAVFLRRTQSLADVMPDEDTRWVQIRKLAFAALLLGHVDCAINVLALSRSIMVGPATRAAARSVSYMRFLDDIEEAVEHTPLRFPPLFTGDAYADKEGRPLRPRTVGIRGWIVERFGRFPLLLAAIRAARRPYVRLKAAAHDRITVGQQRAYERHDSEFERLLRRHGFAGVADLVRARRVAEEPFARVDIPAPRS
jgi:hypothetical protein